ncbi:MAG: hypothetical protein HOC23_15185 [Halieaceae bacterium]|nr:hypothetical protein [Halieaceae bacterium]
MIIRKKLATLILLSFLAGCKLHIVVPTGGMIITASGTYTCLPGQTCVIDVVDLLFDETFTAVPDAGYAFDNWRKRPDGRGFCAPESTKYGPCRLYTSFFSAFPKLFDFLATNQVFYLEPVFSESGVVDGSTKSYPILYIVLNFTDISARVSPAEHYARIYTEPNSARDYLKENFYDRVDLVPAKESQGTVDDGIVSVAINRAHPNTRNTSDPSFNQIGLEALQAAASFIDYESYDADGDGEIDTQELAVVFVYPGGTGASFEPEGPEWPEMRAHVRWLSPEYEAGEKVIYRATHTYETTFHEGQGVYYPSVARATLIHELGHQLFGLLDLYDEDGSSEPMTGWGLMTGGGAWVGDFPQEYIRPHTTGYSKLVSGLSLETQVQEGISDLSLSPLAKQNKPDSRKDDIHRIWLDRYQVRESILLENRQPIGADEAIPDKGLLVTRAQSLAEGNDDDAYRRAELVRGNGIDGVAQVQDTFDLTRTGETPGDGSVDAWGDATANISFASQKASGDIEVDVELTRYGPRGGHLRYDQPTVENTTQYFDGAMGYSDEEAWSGTVFENTTGFTQLDGVEVKLRDDSVVSVQIYEKMVGNTPFNMLYSQLGFNGIKEWNRFLFDIPQNFPPGSSRLIVVQVITAGSQHPLMMSKNRANKIPSSTTYISPNGLTFSQAESAGDYAIWSNILLLSE